MSNKLSALSTMAAGTLAQDTDFILVTDTSAGTSGSLKMTPSAFLTNRTFTGTLTWAGASAANGIAVPDNLANAFNISEGSNAYITIVSTNSAETVKITPLLTCVAGISVTGATGVNLFSIPDNLANAFDITESTNSYIRCTTTNGAETVKITPLLTLVAGALFSGTTGTNLFKLTDNLASALDITEASNSYLKFVTTDSSEAVVIGKNTTLAGTFVITSAGATSLTVGRQGSTNPGFQVDASTSTCVTGVKITPAASGAGAAVVVTSSATDESFTIDAKGAGTISLNVTGTGNVIIGEAVNLQLGTTTGTKIGSATTQKLAFWNATPVVQIANTIDYVTMLTTLGLRASGGTAAATFPGTVSMVGGSSTARFLNTLLAIGPAPTDTYGSAMTIDVTKSLHVIAGVNGTSATVTFTPSAAGSAGDRLTIITSADGTGTVTATFASTFKSSGTQATTASHFSTIEFVSNGSAWLEMSRTTALA